MSDHSVTIIDDDDPTDEQLEKAFRKACAEFGDCVADYESDEFKEEFNKHLSHILTEATLQSLIDKDIVTPMVREDGEIGYVLTGLGQEVADQAMENFALA